MSDSLLSRGRALFIDALERPPADRIQFVREAAAGDADLIAEVESLLGYHDEAAETAQRTPLEAGKLYADRYRILRLLGAGGMGEVYQAQDETLNVAVALKRLTALGPAGIQSLHHEVRLARRITHPGVCRVYDIGEANGEWFLTMEYVEGENLGTLLRRTGRLSSGRVREIGRSVSVALAAAHGEGVLHRDLKPANILIDDTGGVRLTDFGIATSLNDEDRDYRPAGTPTYMAPEQLLAGAELTETTDVYALGLVLHELLTGQPLFPASDATAALTLRQTKSALPPSNVAPGVDPQLEESVMRALALDPRERHPTALRLAADLGDEDPLWVAREAGVTPPPELVAESPGRGPHLSTGSATYLMLALVGLLAVAVFTADRLEDFPSSPQAVRPAVRAITAAETLRSLGFDTNADADLKWGFFPDPTSSSSLLFWYRAEQPTPRADFQRSILDPARDLQLYVGTAPPPSGQVVGFFDELDRLVYLEARAPPASPPRTPTDWGPLLSAAGLEASTLSDAFPGVPPVFADTRAAWEGRDERGGALRVEAAALQGRPVYFSSGIPAAEVYDSLEGDLGAVGLLGLISLPIMLALFVISIVWTVRNLRAGRLDRSGILRILGVVVVLRFGWWVLLLGTVTDPFASGVELSWLSLSQSISMILWPAAFYLAFEPDVRRFWPRTLVGWSRALRGDFRNAPVARALLVGAVAGAALGVLAILSRSQPEALGALERNGVGRGLQTQAALGIPQSAALLLRQVSDAIGRAFGAIFALTLLSKLLRRPGLAVVPFLLLFATLETIPTGGTPLSWILVGLPYAATYALIILRWDLLTLVVAGTVSYSIRFAPLSLDPGAWWAPSSWLIMGFIALVGLTGVWLLRPAASARVSYEAV